MAATARSCRACTGSRAGWPPALKPRPPIADPLPASPLCREAPVTCRSSRGELPYMPHDPLGAFSADLPPEGRRVAARRVSGLEVIRELHEQHENRRRLGSTLAGKDVLIVGRQKLARAELTARLTRC